MNRISSIHFHNHAIFGNQELDFTLPNGQPANSVIFAGENGSGKTQLIEFIHKSLLTNYPASSNYPDQQYIATIYIKPESGYFTSRNSPTTIDEVRLMIGNNSSYHPGKIIFVSNGAIINEHEPIDYRPFLSIYSSVNINYIPQNAVSGITTQTLDNEFNLHNGNTHDIAHDSIQLLVDINAQDNQELSEWADQHNTEVPPPNVRHRRLQRFTKAFNSIFQDKLKFKTIKNNTTPIFIKESTEIDIHQLSSGEKQIVFRGVQLLRDRELLNSMPVFIDEPELSMHPKWEKRIYDYYQQICSGETSQTSQLFLATHSEHLLDQALKDDKCVIIKLSTNNNTVQKFHKSGSGQILPTVTLGEIKYSIFDVYTIDFHISLYGELQSLTGKTSIDGENGIDVWLLEHGAPRKSSSYKTHHYATLPTLVRNHIDHPDNCYTYTDNEFKESTDFLIRQVMMLRSHQE